MVRPRGFRPARRPGPWRIYKTVPVSLSAGPGGGSISDNDSPAASASAARDAAVRVNVLCTPFSCQNVGCRQSLLPALLVHPASRRRALRSGLFIARTRFAFSRRTDRISRSLVSAPSGLSVSATVTARTSPVCRCVGVGVRRPARARSWPGGGRSCRCRPQLGRGRGRGSAQGWW